jgi:hypothetical protein
MVAKLTRLTHKITIQLHLVAESCTIYSSCPRQPVQKLLDTPLYEPSPTCTQTVFNVIWVEIITITHSTWLLH